MAPETQYWLMKAEPETCLEKGIDVALILVKVDHFEKLKTTTWDGVRNPEAKTIMKEKMKLGDQVLFYHSNCVAALAEVSKEGYPDHTAWDPSHPYFDPKTDKANPKWFMVDCTFKSRLAHFVSLALLQHIASSSITSEQKEQIHFLTSEHIKAIGGMPLMKRGRLSVQPVPSLAYEAVVLLGTKGGFSEWPGKWNKSGSKGKRKATSIDKTETASENAPSEVEPKVKASRRSGAKGSKEAEAVEEKKEPGSKGKATSAKKAKEESIPPPAGRRSARLQHKIDGTN
ncbi:unnamed protein product [Tilletia controversa]|uniref:EVE domain-containing protein n=2 Tax=Tilletia TaxID=13289 RepID=A0A8X7SYL7_9BASI|nr:hypothetical protein CF335_g5042 [Tilletia laevis]KAE8250053.1 hypothetical protein A4X06_0g2941 [Tilletia controversa]CAD6885499.1 unnamed protein product [Tilletia caries]CAD6896855.1 unnamed protein product [Tilletia controversa]CAD6920670.1 unnamed protein product [Tilletia laevis]